MKHFGVAAMVPLVLAMWGMAQAAPQQPGAGGGPAMSPEQAKLLESARQSALAYTEKLPDFICTQITHRHVSLLDAMGGSPPDIQLRGATPDETTPWSRQPTETDDVITERLTFFDHKENYEVLTVNGKKAQGVDHLQFVGAITIGEFGTDLLHVFTPETNAAFTWDRMAELHGRQVAVFRFTVPKESGTKVIYRHHRQEAVISYSGEVFIDPESLEVLKITARLDLPKDFPIRSGEKMVEYKLVEIAGREYNLPIHAEVRMRDRKNSYVNRIDFTEYHKFVSQSTVRYGGEGPK